MPFNLSSGEILVLLIVALLVFGGRLPDVARKVGRGLTQFRRGMDDEMRRIDTAMRVEPHPGRREHSGKAPRASEPETEGGKTEGPGPGAPGG